jgi:hypothetical protein
MFEKSGPIRTAHAPNNRAIVSNITALHVVFTGLIVADPACTKPLDATGAQNEAQANQTRMSTTSQAVSIAEGHESSIYCRVVLQVYCMPEK